MANLCLDAGRCLGRLGHLAADRCEHVTTCQHVQSIGAVVVAILALVVVIVWWFAVSLMFVLMFLGQAVVILALVAKTVWLAGAIMDKYPERGLGRFVALQLTGAFVLLPKEVSELFE